LNVNVQSKATTQKGGISTNVDPELATNVLMKSTSAESTRASITIVSDAFQAHELSSSSRSEVAGTLSGKSKHLKRPTFKVSANTSGKIDSDGANEQSMRTFTTEPAQRDDSVSRNEGMGGPKSSSDSHSDGNKYGLELIAFGNIRLETMSWIEAIRRKHGFAENEGTAAPRVPGRTASAKQRAKELREKGIE